MEDASDVEPVERPCILHVLHEEVAVQQCLPPSNEGERNDEDEGEQQQERQAVHQDGDGAVTHRRAGFVERDHERIQPEEADVSDDDVAQCAIPRQELEQQPGERDGAERGTHNRPDVRAPEVGGGPSTLRGQIRRNRRNDERLPFRLL